MTPERKQLINDTIDLMKLRIVFLSLLMAALGYFLGTSLADTDWVRFLAMWFGLACLGGGCGSLNHFWERDTDALMHRTRHRPLPSGRLTPRYALVLGVVLSVVGFYALLIAVNPLTAVLGALTLFFYIGIYTPAKRTTPLSTLIGAIPGAMPPLMGWTAAHGYISAEGLFLFGVLFLWQVPHFLAIAWIYRDDYRRAGFPILSVIDEEGIATAKQVVLYSMALLPLSLLPTLWGITGEVYFIGATVLGLTFLAFGILLALFRSVPHARRLFLVSVIYLPLLGILMCWDKLG